MTVLVRLMELMVYNIGALCLYFEKRDEILRRGVRLILQLSEKNNHHIISPLPIASFKTSV